MKPHKHAELIKAWADGAEIESKVLDINGEWSKWESELNPSWHTSIKIEYRIKPEPKPDLHTYMVVPKEWANYGAWSIGEPNLKLCFDGETGELKSAEVLK